jgi:hypothetical protein
MATIQNTGRKHLSSKLMLQQQHALRVLFDQVHSAVDSFKNVLHEDGPVQLKYVV